MPTAKKRVNLTMDDPMYYALETLSARRVQSISRVSVELIAHALELQEDAHFSRIADARLSRKERRVSHRRAWRT